MNAFRDGSRGGPTIASGWPERLTMVWWLVFGTISVYRAAGGMRLVDTAVQERGLGLAGGARRGSSPWYSPPGSSSTPSRCSPGWAGCSSSS